MGGFDAQRAQPQLLAGVEIAQTLLALRLALRGLLDSRFAVARARV
jgi:hypothetical protein